MLIFWLRKLPLGVLLFLCMPLIIFSSLRGTSGKDSYVYLFRFYSFDSEQMAVSLLSEPLLSFLIYSSRLISDSHVVFYALHATLVCFLFSMALKKYDKLRLYLVSIGPMFLIDGLTNGMRVTLAYHFLLVAVVYRQFLFLAPMAFFAHISSLISIVVIYIANASVMRFSGKVMVYFLAFLALGLCAQYLDVIIALDPRLLSKIHSYSGNALSTSYSGLADLSVLFVLVTSLSFRQPQLMRFFGYALLAGLLCLGFYIFIQFSLSGIRILKMVIVGIFLSQAVISNRSKIAFAGFLFIGVLYSLNFLRQIYFTAGSLPYPG